MPARGFGFSSVFPSRRSSALAPFADERVVLALGADARLRTVARDDHRVVRERKQPLLDRPGEVARGPAPEVRPPDRPGEQRVAGQQERRLAGLLDEEAGRPRRVARGVEGARLTAAERNRLVALELA